MPMIDWPTLTPQHQATVEALYELYRKYPCPDGKCPCGQCQSSLYQVRWLSLDVIAKPDSVLLYEVAASGVPFDETLTVLLLLGLEPNMDDPLLELIR